MKKHSAILAILTITALLTLMFAGCGALMPQKLLAGKWQTSGGMISAEFIPDERKSLQGIFNASAIDNIFPDLVSGTYTVVPANKKNDDDQLIITYMLWSLSKTDTYTLTVNENTLTLKGEGLLGGLFGLSLVLQKQAY